MLHEALRRNLFLFSFFLLQLTQACVLRRLMSEGGGVASMWGLYKQEVDNLFQSADGGKPAALQVEGTLPAAV